MTGIVVTVFVLAHERRGSLPAEAETAWKEDHRRDPNGIAFARTIRLALVSPKSWVFCGYRQRRPIVNAA